MISDVLHEAVQDIKRYQETMPSAYGALKPKIRHYGANSPNMVKAVAPRGESVHSLAQPTTQEGGAMTKRDTYTYDFKVGQRIVHSGITNNPERREQEHKQRWPNGHIKIVGAAKTEEGARKWEETKQKTVTPQRGK